MDKIKTAKLAKYLADNDIDPHEAVRILQEAIRQQVLSRLEALSSGPQRTARIYRFQLQEEVRK